MRLRDFHPNVRLRIYLGFFSSFLFNLVIPYMTIYFARELGALAAGLALTTGVVLSLAAGFWSGYVSDRIGRKKLMVAAELVFLGAYATLALATSPAIDAPWVALAASIAAQVGWGVYGPASDGMLLDVTSPESRKFMYSIFYWSNNLAIALGGMIGAYLFSSHLTLMLLLLTGMTVVTATLTAWRIGETHFPGAADAAANARDLFRSYGRVLRDRTFMWLCLANLLVLSTEFHLGNYIGVRLADEFGTQSLFGAGEQAVRMDGVQMLGLLRTENTLFVVVFSLFAASVMRRLRDRHALYAGMFLYVAGYAFQMWSNSPWPLLVAMLLATWGEVINSPIRTAYHVSIVPDDARGSYMAVDSLAHSGAMMFGTLAVSLGSLFSPEAMAAFTLATGLGGVAIFAALMGKLEGRMEAGSQRKATPVPTGASETASR
ncbi:MFS transporter [Paenibacillus sp.]|uniref:MFS transporter n=1 Tax=Paenibacillus sp. TaxID=58172 RepID=UPI0028110B87|nr:MFS transporter [Paenibacillus sp.]